jgi:hypothetical protein
MGNPGSVAILDHCIADLEKHQGQQIRDLVAAHGESSLYTSTMPWMTASFG